MNKAELKVAVAIAQSVIAQHGQLSESELQEQINKAKEEFSKKLQENATMVGFCTNILLDRLEYLAGVGVVWAKKLKNVGNMFRAELAKSETMIWKHIGENDGQDSFFGVAAYMDKVLGKVVHFSNEQFLLLLQAAEMIEKNELVQVKDEEELESLKNSKELINKIISYMESNPKATHSQLLSYLKAL